MSSEIVVESHPSRQITEKFVDSAGWTYKERRADGRTLYRIAGKWRPTELPSVTTVGLISFECFAPRNIDDLLRIAVRIATETGGVPLDADEIIDAAHNEDMKLAHSGTRLHAAAEAFLKGEPVTTLTDTREEVMFASWLKWWETCGYTILGLEVVVCNPTDKWAGQIDCVARTPNGDVIVVDWKFGAADPHYSMQLNAYFNATHRIIDNGQVRPVNAKIVGAAVVSTIYNEEMNTATTTVVEYVTNKALYQRFLDRLRLLEADSRSWGALQEESFVNPFWDVPGGDRLNEAGISRRWWNLFGYLSSTLSREATIEAAVWVWENKKRDEIEKVIEKYWLAGPGNVN